MPPLDPAQSFKLHSETTDAVRMEALADSYQDAKDRAVQYARMACALKKEARKLEKQAEHFLEDATAKRKMRSHYGQLRYDSSNPVVVKFEQMLGADQSTRLERKA